MAAGRTRCARINASALTGSPATTASAIASCSAMPSAAARGTKDRELSLDALIPELDE
jgi:hypothetical protein